MYSNYWHDPFDYQTYLAKCQFLPDINNEKATKNPTYRDNFITLNNLVLVLFTEDTMIQPRISQWFGFYRDGQDKEVIPMQETDIYKEDWIGLRKLDQEKRIKFLECHGDHLKFTDQWFVDNIIPFLR